MAQRKGLKRGVVILTGVLALAATGVTLHHHRCDDAQSVAQCAAQSPLNWHNWLVGRSGSSQFHFVDLLELLYGHEKRPTSSPSGPLN
ncbi:hypothetical protein [Ferrimonas balearica]|uniref:hypothetical protein n=1 Tax=Ferrimonas balearica TaxID=44012 RepID=UPI001C5940AF|nr:hypothetical protein [Ferrimonas balearica]MBW3140353.1 hypothetical protein [Ferrimonas balearica]MBW3165654.1 hypothetical protein [Ferrimonas balearica]MBY6107832.1 hypothetical protein [Ferrimonas balearica]MBY6225840.1 hypothetical protein [Ferrimonas balearica]